MTAKYLLISVYTIFIIILGLLGHRKTKSFNDFLLGGGKIGPWMTAFSYGTAYFSAVLFIGFAGKIGWGFGLSSLWIAAGNCLIGTLGVWLVMGNSIKKAALKYRVHTMPEFLAARYKSPFLKLFTSSVFFVLLIPYTAAVFMGLSYLFEINFNIPYTYVLLFMGMLTGIYLILGGYKSMAMVDVFFGIIMVFGVILLLYSTVNKAGGMTMLVDKLNSINPGLTSSVGPPGFWALISLVCLTSVAPFAMPQLVHKFYSIKDAKAVKIGMIASTVFAALVTGTAYFTGALTRIFINPVNNPGAFSNGKPIFDALMPELVATVIPPALTIIILLLILSASKSTLAALVLMSSATLTEDLYKGFINKSASDKTLTSMMRICSAVFILLAIILAYLKPAVIVTILAISWGGLASVALGPFIWGLFNRKANGTGAIIAAIGGFGICLFLFIYWGPSMVPQAGSIGMLASIILVPLGSVFAKK